MEQQFNQCLMNFKDNEDNLEEEQDNDEDEMHESINGQLEELQEQNQLLKQENEIKSQRIGLFDKKRKELTKKLRKAEKTAEIQGKLIKKFKSRSENATSESDKKYQKQTQENLKLVSQLNAAKSAEKELRTKLELAKEKEKKLNKKQEKSKSTEKELKNKLGKAKTAQNKLQTQLDQLKTQLDSAKSAQNELKTSLENAKQVESELKIQVESSQKHQNANDNEVEDLKSRNQVLKNEKEDSEKEVLRQKAEIEKSTQEIEQLKAKQKKSKSQKSGKKAKKEIARLHDWLEKSKAEVQLLKDQLKNVQPQNCETCQEKDALIEEKATNLLGIQQQLEQSELQLKTASLDLENTKIMITSREQKVSELEKGTSTNDEDARKQKEYYELLKAENWKQKEKILKYQQLFEQAQQKIIKKKKEIDELKATIQQINQNILTNSQKITKQLQKANSECEKFKEKIKQQRQEFLLIKTRLVNENKQCQQDYNTLKIMCSKIKEQNLINSQKLTTKIENLQSQLINKQSGDSNKDSIIEEIKNEKVGKLENIIAQLKLQLFEQKEIIFQKEQTKDLQAQKLKIASNNNQQRQASQGEQVKEEGKSDSKRGKSQMVKISVKELVIFEKKTKRLSAKVRQVEGEKTKIQDVLELKVQEIHLLQSKNNSNVEGLEERQKMLQKIIDETTTQNHSLKKKVHLITQTNVQLGEIFKSKEEEINKLRSEISGNFELQQKLSEIENQKNELKVQQKDLKKLNQCIKEIQSLENQNFKLREKIKILQNQCKSYRSNYEDLNHNITALKNQYSTEMIQKQAIEEKMLEIEAEKDQYYEQMASLKRIIEEQNTEKSILMKKSNNVKFILLKSHFQKQIKELKRTIFQQQDKVKAITQERESFKQDLQTYIEQTINKQSNDINPKVFGEMKLKIAELEMKLIKSGKSQKTINPFQKLIEVQDDQGDMGKVFQKKIIEALTGRVKEVEVFIYNGMLFNGLKRDRLRRCKRHFIFPRKRTQQQRLLFKSRSICSKS